MKKYQRKDHKTRLEAFDLLINYKLQKKSRKNIIDLINIKYKIPIGTLYDWCNGRIPPGRKGKIIHNSSFYYVLGALLGDGCAYNWRITNNYVILVGNCEFTKKYSKQLFKCTKVKVKPHIDRNKNIWFVRTNNYELFKILKKYRTNSEALINFTFSNNNSKLEFIEGFFDAEGCVKIIKEKVRKTPKICLDITNTNKNYLDLIQRLLNEALNINSNYSIQKPKIGKDGLYRKIAYHLRIYKKESIRIFFKNLKTIKLIEEKKKYLKNWLNNGK